MRWSFRTQILIPFALLLIGVVGLTATLCATLAVQRLKAERLRHSREVASVLSLSQFPVTPEILGKLKILTGCELIVTEGSQFAAATLPTEGISPHSLPTLEELKHRGQSYEIIPALQRAPSSQRIFILAPRSAETLPWRELVWPIVGLSLATGGLATLIAAWLAARYARQILVIQNQLQDLSDHHYRQSDLTGSVIELTQLQQSANQLAQRLAGFEHQIAQAERLRLLGQLSGGLAHTLRNALAGARLAIQYHQKRCPTSEAEVPLRTGTGLDAAQLQLRLVEDQVQGLLQLGSPAASAPIAGDLCDILCEVERLIAPVCAHHRVTCEFQNPEELHAIPIQDSAGMRISILNLCLNAVEAAGPKGNISVTALRETHHARITVSDNGPGITLGIAERFAEPFVTGKPEGIGLGLMIAREVVQRLHGNLTWERSNDRTMVILSWPLPPNSETPAPLNLSQPATSTLGVSS